MIWLALSLFVFLGILSIPILFVLVAGYREQARRARVAAERFYRLAGESNQISQKMVAQAREIRQWATPPMRQFLHRVESMDNILDAEEIDG